MPHDGKDVHLAWGISRAESIGDALRIQQCAAKAIALPGDLSLGPIDPRDLEARRRWLHANTHEDPDTGADKSAPEGSWIEATATGVHPVFWVCRSDAGEHACLLEFASRMAGRPFDIVEATNLQITTVLGRSDVWSLGQLRPVEIVAAGLLTRRRLFTPAESAAARADWERLRRENAPLRVIRDGCLVSAPLTHYDGALTSQALPDWEPLIAVIGRTLHRLGAAPDPPGRGHGYPLLFARILVLGEAGALDVRGPGPGLRDYEVRRSSP